MSLDPHALLPGFRASFQDLSGFWYGSRALNSEHAGGPCLARLVYGPAGNFHVHGRTGLGQPLDGP